MYTFISLLRGINVSGQKKISMKDLLRLYEGLYLTNVVTYVQSGNVVFDSPESDASILVKQIEAQIEQFFGYAVPVLIRAPNNFERILASNPFLTGRNEDPARLYVTFLYTVPSQNDWDHLKPLGDGEDEFSVGEEEIFLFCPNGYGRTKLNNSFFERKLKTTATTRNWKTVNALYRMAVER